MLKLIQQLKNVRQHSFFSDDKKTHEVLLNNDDILKLLLKVQTNKKTSQHKHDIAFRQRGDYQSIYHGHGMDYEESRHYQPGDDPRYMNWQLSARTGQFYMKVFREERQPGVFILVDRRSTMRFGTQQRLKVTQAVRAAAMAAFSAQENNFSIGGVILDSQLEWFKENKNKQAVFDFIHQAARPVSPVFNEKPNHQNINDVLRLLNQVLTKGSNVYLISDFYDINESSHPILLQLSSTHKVHAIHVLDPAEKELPKAGSLILKSAISDKQQHVNSNSLHQQHKYQSAAADHFSTIKQLLKSMDISYEAFFTTDDMIEQKQ
jgi:uncharacterized protein (DUF58 family)